MKVTGVVSIRPSSEYEQIITFLRKRDYRFVKELGKGACGQTVLLADDMIGENFVCKKYSPIHEMLREQLFQNFIREIKLLHKLHHENVVRVFNYYIYPDKLMGYILMEYVDGLDIKQFVTKHPEQTNDLFLQTINGFAYLESQSILHRDIRPGNLLVHTDGTVKIIDLGFGKHIQTSGDFDKSIDLNWWCPTPQEFVTKKYDFRTEVYFVGKLFEELILENDIAHFQHNGVLEQMCQHQPGQRIESFSDVAKVVRNKKYFDFNFSDTDRGRYQSFVDALCKFIARVETNLKYIDDTDRVARQLDEVYRNSMLEEFVPDSTLVVRCIIEGGYYFHRHHKISVEYLGGFVRFLKSATEEERRIILANLRTRLDTLPRYEPPIPADDDIPF